jgi:hypothetical protein
MEGPDLFVAVTLPAGTHRVSLLFSNFDGQIGKTGLDADRDYYVQFKRAIGLARHNPADLGASELVDDSVFPGSDRLGVPAWCAIDAELSETLAASRVPQFVRPVYKRFLVRGAGTRWIKVGRNHSYSTKLQGVFVDDEGGDDPAAAAADAAPVVIQGMEPIQVPHATGGPATVPGEAGAAVRLWDELDASAGKEGYGALCWPGRLAAYRAALAAEVDEGTLANWRWRLGLWTALDREQMHRNIDKAHYSPYSP